MRSDRAVWNFLEIKERGRRIVNPAEGILFEDLSPLGALIRESAQNSLDAGTGTEQVKMRFSLQRFSSSQSEVKERWFSNLKPHLRAVEASASSSLNQNLSVLVIEDFGTRGLTGDPEDTRLEVDDNNRFYWFHRNVNRTMATEDRGGSYGYGKSSFTRASKIFSFLSVSRDSDGTKVFGSSLLKTHEINGKRYDPYGDFGFLEDGIVLPDTSLETFNEICNDFELQRGGSTGLSIIIPFPEEEYSVNEILESLIRNYLLPICQNQLSVEVSDGKNEVTLDSSTIEVITQRLAWAGEIPGARTNLHTPSSMVELVKLALETNKFPLQQTYEISMPTEKAPTWEHDDILPSPSEISDNLESGNSVMFRVNMAVRESNSPIKLGTFEIYIRKIDAIQVRSDVVWIRRYLSVPFPEKPPLVPGHVAIVHIKNGPLERMFRLSEEVAHTVHKYNLIAKKYTHAKSTIDTVRSSASSILTKLRNTIPVIESDWLDDWFEPELDENKDSGSRKRRRRRKKRIPNAPEDESEPDGAGTEFLPPIVPDDLDDTHEWDLVKLSDGFRIEGEILHNLTYRFTIQCAYDREDGKSLKKWSKFDFDFSKDVINVNGTNIQVIDANENQIIFDVDGPTDFYQLEVSGFDKNRDLKVHARPRKSQKNQGVE